MKRLPMFKPLEEPTIDNPGSLRNWGRGTGKRGVDADDAPAFDGGYDSMIVEQADYSDPESIAIGDETAATAVESIESITGYEYEVCVLVTLEGYSVAEAAEHLGISLDVAKKANAAANAQLREMSERG